MIDDRKRPGSEQVRCFTERAWPHVHQPSLAQQAVQIDRPANLHMAVLADHPNRRPDGACGVEPGDTCVVQLLRHTLHVAALGTEALRVVIKVRQVDERQVRPFGLQHFGGAARDPLRAGQPGHRSPKRLKREGAEPHFQAFAQSRWRAGDAKDLVAVGAVVRLRRHADVHRGALVEPPEELGAAERQAAGSRPLPRGDVQRFALDQPVGLLPEARLAGVAP